MLTGAAADLARDPGRAAGRGLRRGADPAAGPGRAGRRSWTRGAGRPAPGRASDRAAVRPAPRRQFTAVRPRPRTGCAEIAAAAEAAGFDAIYVMDHFRQIPQVGRAWDDFLESYTTLGYLAACTRRVRLGALVTGVTYRNVGAPRQDRRHPRRAQRRPGRLRARPGLVRRRSTRRTAGPSHPTPDRYALLEDALQAAADAVGTGQPAFTGAGAVRCPTRPATPARSDRVPLIVGGGGERRTLRLAARYADAANVFGDAATVAAQARRCCDAHCAAVGRDPAQVALTHLSTTLVGADDRPLAAAGRPPAPAPAGPRRATPPPSTPAPSPTTSAASASWPRPAPQEVMIRLPDLTDADPLDRTAKVIAAFR